MTRFYLDNTQISGGGGAAEVDWEHITDKPVFADVATSGNYEDLSNLPTIPTVPTDVSELTNDADYQTGQEVEDAIGQALSSVYKPKGSVPTYADLPTTPEVGDVYNVTDTGMNYAWTGAEWDALGLTIDLTPYALKSELSSVATSGDYEDLSNLPDIPDITGLAAVAWSGDYNDLGNTPNIPVVPTNVSDFANDADYQTGQDVDDAIGQVLSSVYKPKGSVATYEDLPANPEIGDVYNVLDTGMNYVWDAENEWDALGTFVDLTPYAKKEELSSVASSGDYEDLSNKPDLSTKQDTLVPGENIKTVNDESLLGSGNIDIQGGGYIATYDQTPYADVKDAIDADKEIIVNFANNKNLIIPTYCTYVVGGNITMYGIYKSANEISLSTITVTPEDAWTISHDAIQPKLTSGTNIKTINNQSLLGSGNIEIDGKAFIAIPNETTYEEVAAAISNGVPLYVKPATTPYQVYAYADQLANEIIIYYWNSSCSYIGMRISRSSEWTVVPISWLQPALESGVNIKTVNNQSLLGAGNIDMPLGDLTMLTTEDQSSLVASINEVYEKCGEPFRVKQWLTNTLNVEIPVCTEDISNTSIPKLTFTIDAEEGALYQIVGMIAYEVFDAESGGSRINCWPVCQFTGNGQKELGVRFMCAGTTRKTAKRISAWVLLKRRA